MKILILAIALILVLLPSQISTDTVTKIVPKVKEIQEVEPVEKPVVVSLEEIPEYTIPRNESLEKLKIVLSQFAKEKIPFDEPRVEVGQEDGKLRELWRGAWHQGRASFGYRGEKYYVMSSEGDAIPPQVCADFVVDSFDRLGGSWWYKNGRRGIRVDTPSSFSKYIKSREKYPRRVSELVQVMRERPDLFHLLYSKERQGVVMGRVSEVQDVFREYNVGLGDIIFINGKTPWDRHHEHWHSFIVYDFDSDKNDWRIVGNANMIAIRWLKTEAKRTPRRKLWYIFRPTDVFLTRVIDKISLENDEQMETSR